MNSSHPPYINKSKSLLAAIIVLAILVSGCDKFEGDQTIPSYLKIDSLSFIREDESQGTNNQKIVDAWVYIDDDLIGGFELPALVPILNEGTHKLEIRPGIILNGIADTRAPNPCFKPIYINNFDLFIDSIVTATGTTTYYENAEFIWMEDFEDPSLAIHESINSDTVIYRTEPANAPGAFLDPTSQFSGISYMDETRNYVQLVSDDGDGGGFVFDRGDFIFLEMNYRNTVPLVIGLYIELMDNTIQERSFLVINPTDDWKKIYINFTPIVNETVDAVNYKVFIEAYNADNDANAFMMLDNLKLVTRPNL